MTPRNRSLFRNLPSLCVCPQRRAAIVLFLVLFLALGCSQKEHSRPRSKVPVITATVTTQDVPLDISVIGKATAYSSVNLTSRVTGEVIKCHVQEGQTVAAGLLLFSIDDKPYQAVLAAARSNLEKDRIRLEKALKDAKRYADLLAKDYVTKDQAEQSQADARALAAAVKGDEAAVESAALNVSYCRITAPIGGKVGAILIHQGNLVKENDAANPLMVINQVNPIYVQFSVPEQYLPEIRKRMAEGSLVVHAAAPGGQPLQKKGRLTFLDNAIQSDSGTIDLKAVFDNANEDFWPGQFVNVVLVLGTRKNAVIVPGSAIQVGQAGPYVFVVKDDMTVAQRNVTVGAQTDDHTVIEAGLTAGETVVTDGQLMLSPGTPISVKNAAAAGEK
jgi:membrane fusion protein, multidrug efflux system